MLAYAVQIDKLLRVRPVGSADGSYMQHIATETGANITLRGKGSGIQEGDALHIYISAAIPKAFSEAAKLAQNLLDTVKAEHDKQVCPFGCCRGDF